MSKQKREKSTANTTLFNIPELKAEIKQMIQHLAAHPIYQHLNSLEAIKCFMGYHVFAVFDFMSLLKSLQNQITCTSLPWKPSGYPGEIVRLINEIVTGEESDFDEQGNPISHFDLYIRAMEEVGADTFEIFNFIENDCNVNLLKPGVREFVDYNFAVAQSGPLPEVAAVFFYGREHLIPEIFFSILRVLEQEEKPCPKLLYYLRRHIEVDRNEHGPLAQKCLAYLCDTEAKKLKALSKALKALYLREQLWDCALVESEQLNNVLGFGQYRNLFASGNDSRHACFKLTYI